MLNWNEMITALSRLAAVEEEVVQLRAINTELLATLKLVIETTALDYYADTNAQVRAAIAKAEGKPYKEKDPAGVTPTGSSRSLRGGTRRGHPSRSDTKI
jgi:hypothetical protein